MELNDNNKTIIIIVETDRTKHEFLKQQFKNTEGYKRIFDTIEQAISTLEDLKTSSIIPLEAPQYELTHREKQVTRLLAEGHLYKEIADILHVSLDSVKQYVHQIYRKLGVTNRTGALNKYLPPLSILTVLMHKSLKSCIKNKLIEVKAICIGVKISRQQEIVVRRQSRN